MLKPGSRDHIHLQTFSSGPDTLQQQINKDYYRLDPARPSPDHFCDTNADARSVCGT